MSAGWLNDSTSYDYQLRFVLVGDSTVGKSSLLKYFVSGEFNNDSQPTVGVDFYVRTMDIDDGVRIKLQLWDTAGQERFRSITASYFRNCAGVLLVFDLTKRSSFHHIPDWMKECKQHNFHNVTFALIGHKADLEQHREVTTREASLFADFHDMNYFETSTIDGQNIPEALFYLTQAVYQIHIKNVTNGQIKNTGITKGHRESIVHLGNGSVRNTVVVANRPLGKDKCCQS